MTEKKIIIIIYSILAAYCSYFILGNSFFLFTDNSWINSIDMVQDLVSWNFFNDDIWRFPIGMNPNYGLDIGNSIVFTGSIAVFAISGAVINGMTIIIARIIGIAPPTRRIGLTILLQILLFCK